MAKKGRIFIGTSGWMYKDWGEKFYPPDMKKGFLSYIAREFSTVEINSSFYHLPLTTTFAKWKNEVPGDFVFAVKISRFITHQKRLAGVREPLRRFISRAQKLEEKLGPILIQLPPRLPYDESQFNSFLKSLDTVAKREKCNARFAFEPRHESWIEELPEVRERLGSYQNMCLVFAHSARIPSIPTTDENVLSSFVYFRFHGPKDWAASPYGARRLKPYAKRITQFAATGKDVFAYFNNDIHGYAIDDARMLKAQLGLS